MKKFKIMLIAIGLIVTSIILYMNFHPVFGQSAKGKYLEHVKNSPNFSDGSFKNIEPTTMMIKSETSTFEVMKKFIFGVENGRPSNAVPSKKFDKEAFVKSDSGVSAVWFGHSTVLLNVEGRTVLTDPVFSKYASPVPFVNGSFDYENEYSADDLPEIDFVLISHDHFDHLDYKTIKSINHKVKKFYVPLGVESHLLSWGVAEEKIVSADWHESFEDSGLKFMATPARHFSGRSIFDRNKTLWCSWVVKGEKSKVFFGGDSGYGKHFAEIGQKYGPFDFALLECGQYHENWGQIHCLPEQTAQACVDLQSRTFLPIHRSKYQLSIHTWTEPWERVSAASEKLGINITDIVPGEISKIKIAAEELIKTE